VSVDPSVLRPGARAVLSAQVQSPPVAGSREARVACDLTLNGRQVRRWLKLRSTAPDGMLVFTDAYTVPATATSQAGEITARLIGYPYDVVEGGEQARGLFLVTVSDDEDSAARTRSLAFRALQGGDNVQAALRLKELCALQAACVWDCEQLARVSEILHDTATAAAALKLAVDLTPEKPEQPRLVRIGRYAAALVANAESGKVLTDYGPVVQRVKEPERPKKIPDALMVALGNAYVQQGKLDEAEAISQALLKWPDSGLLEETGRFRNALRLAQAGARVKAEPASAEAHAIYGRALMDQCRWEEAVVELRTAATADASLPSIQHDLAYAILHLQNTQSLDGTDLDAAIRSAERATQVQDDKGRVQLTKDFFTWHRYALLLYAQARRQQDAGDRNAPTTIRGCRDALRAALRCGRSGARVSSGVYAGFIGYLGGSMVAVPGFAYPEAGSDFELLQGLLALEQHPDDYLTHLRIGSALVDLQQPALADAPIRRALALRPDCADARYAAACVAIQTGDRRAALEALSEVARANPRHPGANLLLAKLHTEDGDTAAAAACLSAHARAYGAARPAAPAPQSVRLP
jgi:tetratricopeptide (TPR) repeat protein